MLKEGAKVNLKPNPGMTNPESFERLMNKINDIRLRNVRGHTPQNPVGYDLLPSNSTRPTPWVVGNRMKVLPVKAEVSEKLVEYAIRTEGKYTSEYVHKIPLRGRLSWHEAFALQFRK